MKVHMLLAVVVVLVSAVASAQPMVVKISAVTITSDGLFGGCMAKISPIDAINDQAGIPDGFNEGQCRRGFVSFDCDGNFIPSKKSQALLSAAQLSLVTGASTYIVVDPTKKNNFYCLASRIDSRSN